MTTGSDFVDYFIVDAQSAPPRMSQTFSEKLIYMPYCYIVNDHKQVRVPVDFNDKKKIKGKCTIAPDR